MAIHIPIVKNEKIKNDIVVSNKMQKVINNIIKQCKNGLTFLKGSLKYEYLKRNLSFNDYKNYKEHENDEIFITSRTVNKERKSFEIHYDNKNNKIIIIYLVE